MRKSTARKGTGIVAVSDMKAHSRNLLLFAVGSSLSACALGFLRLGRFFSTSTVARRAASIDASGRARPQTGTWDYDSWVKGFETARTEEAYELEGVIPAELSGTVFRNGHAKFDDGSGKPDGVYTHPFDGDGMISAVTFQDGRAYFRNRFVRTEGFKKEAKAKRILYRGMFGTQKPGGVFGNAFDLRRKNVANTNVLYWGNRLLALWEGGLPHLMEPMSLETLGESKVGGVLKAGATFAAHPRYDPLTDRFVFFATEVGPFGSTVTLREFDNEFKLVGQERIETVKGFCLIHDFTITPNYYVIHQAPLAVNVLPYVLGLRGIASGIQFLDNKPSIVHLIPRHNKDQPRVEIEVDGHFSFHHCNAFETETGEVVIDTIRVPKLLLTDEEGAEGVPVWSVINYEQDVPKSTLWRYTLNPAQKTYKKEEVAGAKDVYLDFPTINTKYSSLPYRYTYVAAGRHEQLPTPVGTVMKIDFQEQTRDSWTCAPHEFISESVFVPREGEGRAEDDGWLVTFVFNGKTSKSEVLIFDAREVSRGPISRLQLRSNIPHSLHGTWTPAVWDGEDILRKFKVSCALERNNWNQVTSGLPSIF